MITYGRAVFRDLLHLATRIACTSVSVTHQAPSSNTSPSLHASCPLAAREKGSSVLRYHSFSLHVIGSLLLSSALCLRGVGAVLCPSTSSGSSLRKRVSGRQACVSAHASSSKVFVWVLAAGLSMSCALKAVACMPPRVSCVCRTLGKWASSTVGSDIDRTSLSPLASSWVTPKGSLRLRLRFASLSLHDLVGLRVHSSLPLRER
jgi:hypothetical protein